MVPEGLKIRVEGPHNPSLGCAAVMYTPFTTSTKCALTWVCLGIPSLEKSADILEKTNEGVRKSRRAVTKNAPGPRICGLGAIVR